MCLVIPYNLVFPEEQGRTWDVIYLATDFIFLIDIIVAFCTTVPDEELFTEIIDRKRIAMKYLGGWFWIDFISIIPFDLVLTAFTMQETDSGGHRGSGVNNLVRVSKMGKITKIIRLLRLVKVVKIFKNKERLTAHFSKTLQVNSGTERLAFSGMIFIFMSHIFACAWTFLGQF